VQEASLMGLQLVPDRFTGRPDPLDLQLERRVLGAHAQQIGHEAIKGILGEGRKQSHPAQLR
jgi:hypothetical protein